MIESLLSIVAIGTLGFWALIAVVSIIILACIENERSTAPAFLLAGCIALYWHALRDCSINWSSWLGVLFLYSLVGAIWSVYRWHRYVNQLVNEAIRKGRNTLSSTALIAYYNKQKIVTWIAYWPWSAFWFLTGNFFTPTYDHLSGIYDNISSKAEHRLADVFKDQNNK